MAWRDTFPGRRWMRALVLGVAIGLGPVAALAAKHALVIGNAAYENLPDLQNTHSDAKAYAATFTQLGFAVHHHTDLDEVALGDALGAFLDQISPGDDVTFFFAGHGWSHQGTNYLLPVDAPKDGSARHLARRSLALKNGVTGILDEIRETGAGLQLAIVDACRDNPFATSGTRSIGNARGLARIVPEQGSFVVFSAGEGQSALDRLDGDPATETLSVFSRHFLPLLSRGMYLEDAISEAQILTAQAAATQNHLQTPAYYDQTLGKTCLHDSCAAGAVAVAQPARKPSWTTQLSVPGLDELKARDALALADGGVIVSYGYREFPGSPPWVGLARLDSAGQLMWDKRLEALKNNDEKSFLVVANLLPFGADGAGVYQRPNLVVMDGTPQEAGRAAIVPKDHFMGFVLGAGKHGIGIGDGPIDRSRGDTQYKFVARVDLASQETDIIYKIEHDDEITRLANAVLMPAADGSSVLQTSATEFRGYDPSGREVWRFAERGKGQLRAISGLAFPGGSGVIFAVADVSHPQGVKLAELRITHIAGDGGVTASPPQQLRFQKFAPYALATPIADSNGAIVELVSSDTQDQVFLRVDETGKVIWTRNFGAKTGSVIATSANRGKTGAVFLDFRRDDTTLSVHALDDQGQSN